MSTITDIGTLISRNPEIHAGCPIIAGTGVTVRRIAIWYKQGLTAEEIVERIGHLTLTQVYAALTYYHANREEVDADIAAEETEGDRIEALNSQRNIQKQPTDIDLEVATAPNYPSRREFMQFYEIVKTLPQNQASEILNFAEFIRAKYLNASQSTDTVDSLTSWQELVYYLAGAWADDFPTLEEIRTGEGEDIFRESF